MTCLSTLIRILLSWQSRLAWQAWQPLLWLCPILLVLPCQGFSNPRRVQSKASSDQIYLRWQWLIIPSRCRENPTGVRKSWILRFPFCFQNLWYFLIRISIRVSPLGISIASFIHLPNIIVSAFLFTLVRPSSKPSWPSSKTKKNVQLDRSYWKW